MRSLSCLPPIITFNSLSRDHRKSETRQSIHQRKPATFNSLSRDHKVAKPVSGSTSHPFHFQLPLSGSPRADQAASLLPIIITFNSLSRDHRQPIPPGSSLLPVITFNSLSRDHACRAPTGELDDVERARLSTPSLGITEPDSGIFRLSAAFCRGTPSHK